MLHFYSKTWGILKGRYAFAYHFEARQCVKLDILFTPVAMILSCTQVFLSNGATVPYLDAEGQLPFNSIINYKFKSFLNSHICIISIEIKAEAWSKS